MITQNELKKLITYDPETGIFTWNIDKNNQAKKGSECGGKHHTGYRHITIDNKRYQAHRLAWLYMTGDWPKNFIDHINEIRDDNRFVNLREATRSQNGMNRGKQIDNKLGHKNICILNHYINGKTYSYYFVQINYSIDGVKKRIAKQFNTLEEEIIFRNSKLLEIHGDFYKI